MALQTEEDRSTRQDEPACTLCLPCFVVLGSDRLPACTFVVLGSDHLPTKRAQLGQLVVGTPMEGGGRQSGGSASAAKSRRFFCFYACFGRFRRFFF